MYNDKRFKKTRRVLRKEQTDVERILWLRLRNKQINGLKFFRQYSVGPYILDFYNTRYHIGIELDGGQHLESDNQTYDEKRAQFLKTREIHLLRFWNNQVIENIEGVLEKIMQEIKNNNPS